MEKTKLMQQLEQLVKAKLRPVSLNETINTIKNLHVSLCYENEANEIVVSFINKLLNTSENRQEGLKLLNLIIFKIPLQFILNNYLSWIPLCLCLNNVDVLNDIKIQLLGKIIQTCSGTQDFDKFLVNNLQKLIDVCLSAQSSSNIDESTLDCIKICIEKYPSTCIPSKSKLEQSLAKYITSDQPKNIIMNVGSAFHILQQVGENGNHSNLQKSNWATQFCKLCVTVHTVYNDFFEDVTEYITTTDLVIAPFPITGIESSGYSSIKKQTERATVLRNLVIFLNQMFLEKYPYLKTVSIPVVLNVVKRGLMVDVYDDCENSIEQTQFSILLYNHQIDLLYLLRSFIACFKQNLLPFSMTISKIIMDCLQRMQKQFFRNNCKYQEAVYKVLSYWISTIHNNLNCGTHNIIVSAILREITPQVNNVVLSLNKSLSQDQAPKGKRNQLTDSMTNQLPSASESISKDFLKMQENRCIYALRSCVDLLENINLQLDETNFNALFKTVMTNILSVQANKIDHPYTNANCVVLLYKVLHSLFHQTSYCVRPIIPIAIKLFTNGQNLSNDHDVRMICNNSLQTLEKLCQPLCPSFSIPTVTERLNDINIRTEEDRQLFKEFQDRVSNDSPTNVDGDKLISPTIPKSPEIDPLPQLVNPDKKINILDMRIIKQASATNEARPEATHPAKQNNVKKQKQHNKRDSKEIKLNLEKPLQTEETNGTDAPPIKQIKIEADDDEEELMLASFNDSVND